MPKVIYTKAKGLHQTAGTGSSGFGFREVIRTSTDATPTLTIDQAGALIIMDATATTTITLPQVTAADIGAFYEFQVTTASDNLRKVVTAYDNDYIVGGVTHGFDGADSGATHFVSSVVGDNHVAIQIDDNLANSGGGNANFKLTAILTGNVAASGGAKAVWAIVGHVAAQANNSDGSAIFA